MTTIRTIAVGIIRNVRREIFTARRLIDAHMGGYWEFPGGKVEEGETPEQALYRELREEVGIEVERAQLLATTQHNFVERKIEFYFFLVEYWRGTPCGNEGQMVRWCPQQDLRENEFPLANEDIIRQLAVD